MSVLSNRALRILSCLLVCCLRALDRTRFVLFLPFTRDIYTGSVDDQDLASPFLLNLLRKDTVSLFGS